MITERLEARVMVRMANSVLVALQQEAQRQGRKPSALARKLIEDGLKDAPEPSAALEANPMYEYQGFGP